MKTIETQHQFIFQSEDDNGKFEFRVHKDCSQIQLETGIGDFDNEAFADTSGNELRAIRDMLNKILDKK